MKLSEHFTLAEFTRSDTAVRIGDANTPTPEHLANLRRTAAFMEAVRAFFGDRAITVTSCYRNPRVNRAVKGVDNSAHALGYAVDFHVAGLTDFEVATRLARSGIRFDQLIYEKGRCVHISFDPRFRGQVLSQPGGPGSPCLPGIQP